MQNIHLFSFYFPTEVNEFLKQTNFLQNFIFDSIKFLPQSLKHSRYNKKVKKNFFFENLLKIKKKVYFLGILSLMKNSNLYGLDFQGFKIIVENLINVVKRETKKKAERFEEIKKIEDNITEEDENDFFNLKSNEQLSPLINLGLSSSKDVYFYIKINFLTLKLENFG